MGLILEGSMTKNDRIWAKSLKLDRLQMVVETRELIMRSSFFR
jgi:hypothetical protein